MLNNLIYNSKQNSKELLKSKHILEMLFSWTFELNEVYTEILNFINIYSININSKTLNNLKNDINLIENDSLKENIIEWENIRYFPFISYFINEIITDLSVRENLLIRKKIFEKYVDLFHSIEKNIDFLSVSDEISKTVTNILKQQGFIDYSVVNNKVIWIYQNIHWDLTINKYNSSWNTQIDLFTNKNINLLEVSDITQSIHIYQYTENLLSKILEFCYKTNYTPNELIKYNDINSKIPNATWATDTDELSIRILENNLLEKQSYNLSINMNPSESYIIELDFENNKINLLLKDKLVFEILKEELWAFIILLLKYPWRSINTLKWMLHIFENINS